jgi:hypothetical protein
LPELSVAVDRNVVVELSATETVRPGEANLFDVPEIITLPAHVLSAYIFTVVPLGAVPFSLGLLLLEPEIGLEELIVGVTGKTTARVVKKLSDEAPIFPAASFDFTEK